MWSRTLLEIVGQRNRTERLADGAARIEYPPPKSEDTSSGKQSDDDPLQKGKLRYHRARCVPCSTYVRCATGFCTVRLLALT